MSLALAEILLLLYRGTGITIIIIIVPDSRIRYSTVIVISCDSPIKSDW